jgi:serine/threonine protein kinase
MSELEALKKLNHPSIIALKGCCLPTETEGAKIIMEYLGGGSLEDLLKHKPRWWTSTRKVIAILQLVKGMKYIHSEGFIHRNLKPTNILIDDDRNVKISDFGTSRIYETDVTMTRNVMGNALFIAPELCEGDYDEKVDVYAFGIILYEIVTGNRLDSNMIMVKGQRPDIPKDVLPFTRHLIEKCWSDDASKRSHFSDIWKSLKESEFKVMNEVDDFGVKAEVSRIESHERSIGIKTD